MDPHYYGKLDPDPQNVKIQEMKRLKMEPGRAVNDHKGGVEAQVEPWTGGRGYTYNVGQWSHIRIIFMRSRIRIRNKVKIRSGSAQSENRDTNPHKSAKKNPDPHLRRGIRNTGKKTAC